VNLFTFEKKASDVALESDALR